MKPITLQTTAFCSTCGEKCYIGERVLFKSTGPHLFDDEVVCEGCGEGMEEE